MQRPRFKRHWDDRKWQNPINSMTESATSNMFSSPFFSPLCLSFLPRFHACLSLLSSPSLSVSSFLSPLFTQDVFVSQFLSLSHPTAHPFSGCPSFSLLFHSLGAYHPFFVNLCLFLSVHLVTVVSFPEFLCCCCSFAVSQAPDD